MADLDRKLYPGPDARKRFGRTLKIWRLRGGWTQATISQWGKAAGFSPVTDAVINHLERGITDQPQPLTFIQLAIANERLANKDYGVISDRRLRELVQAQEPITDDDGTVWTAADFFSHFCALKEPPSWARQSSMLAITAEEAEKLSWQQRDMFLKYAQDCLLDRIEAWRELQQHCTGMSREQVEAFKLVLGGHKSWTPEELAEMTDESGMNLSIQALQNWCDQESLCQEFRNMCPD